MSKPLSPEQIAGHRMVTRGMNGDTALGRDAQLAQARTDKQRHVRVRGLCIRCEADRDTAYPVCGRCQARELY